MKPGGSTPSAGLFPLFPLLAAGLVIGLLAACQSAPSPERKPVKVGNWTVETRATVLIDQAVVH
ncbi:hypothetical protein [Afifella sp. IM 167]|uniref:hypothetical protein n=1 Tax=Afifella sp. IM 167 TaxID=2033586 RepID=UPI001CCFEC2E|nr:hypothetical protein [Afifella sp. IM 167]MBZ8133595.1 hypothetical protein [Afifella sp. IM 167]